MIHIIALIFNEDFDFAIFIFIKLSGIQIEGCDPVILQISHQSIGQSLVVQNSGLEGFYCHYLEDDDKENEISDDRSEFSDVRPGD